ncbi:MAG: hypothetical protein QW371_05410 [Candidatus Bathyarchaeia archaeon]
MWNALKAMWNISRAAWNMSKERAKQLEELEAIGRNYKLPFSNDPRHFLDKLPVWSFSNIPGYSLDQLPIWPKERDVIEGWRSGREAIVHRNVIIYGAPGPDLAEAARALAILVSCLYGFGLGSGALFIRAGGDLHAILSALEEAPRYPLCFLFVGDAAHMQFAEGEITGFFDQIPIRLERKGQRAGFVVMIFATHGIGDWLKEPLMGLADLYLINSVPRDEDELSAAKWLVGGDELIRALSIIKAHSHRCPIARTASIAIIPHRSVLCAIPYLRGLSDLLHEIAVERGSG